MIVARGLAAVILTSSLLSSADTNATDTNTTSKKQRLKQAIQHEMQMEEKYAKEQKFYGPDEYNLKAKEVDPASLNDVEPPAPDYSDNYGACDTK